MELAPDAAVDTHWVQREWPRGRLAAFRSVVGALLSFHFLKLAIDAPPLLSASGLYDLATAWPYPSAVARWLDSDLSVQTVQAVYCGAAVLAGLIALGLAQRAFAFVLFVLAAGTHQALLPVSYIDDACASWALFWLMALPRTSGKARAAVVPGLAVDLLLINTLIIYVSVTAWRSLHPTWPREPLVTLACFAVPALLISPGTWSRRVGVIGQLALHAYLLATTRVWFCHGVLLATGVLFWGHRSVSDAVPSVRWNVTTGAAAGAVYVALTAALLIEGAASSDGEASRVGRLLMALGLDPTSPGMPAASDTSLAAVRPGDEKRVVLLEAGAQPSREGMLLAYFLNPRSVPPGMAADMLERVAQRYCEAHAGVGAAASLYLRDNIEPAGALECDLPGRRPLVRWPGIDGVAE